MDPDGAERHRIEGYLPLTWFGARLRMGLARVAFMRKDWSAAQTIYTDVAQQFADLALAAEAIYWRGVCEYKATNDHTVLGPAAKELIEKYPGDEWTLKADPWVH